MNTKFSNLPGRINVGIDKGWALRRKRYSILVRSVSALVGLAIGIFCARYIDAQPIITYFSSTPQSPTVRRQCKEAGDALRQQLSIFPHPDSWQFLVVCDDASWTPAMRLEHVNDAEFVYGSTYFETRTTILRGSGLRNERNGVTADHLVSHELAHIAERTASETRAEFLAQKWMKDRARQLVAAVTGP
jgi:hypothetical protein